MLPYMYLCLWYIQSIKALQKSTHFLPIVRNAEFATVFVDLFSRVWLADMYIYVVYV